MTKEEAKNLVVKTFEQAFDESRFLYFIKNLVNGLDESKTQVWAGNYIPESYRAAIKSYKRIGQYSDKKNNVIDILTVNVKRDNTLERARTLQRNFIARHLKQRNHEAALVAFYTEEIDDWRFSLVIMELSLTKTKVEIELSPAKRYSFLVGKNERSHTAQNQFVNLLIDKNDKHTLDDIEQAFNIETVTKEFFLEYRDLFIRTKTSLDKILKSDSRVIEEFDNKGIDSVNFSKKLLGQIVFLYFLQKKGWFGVGRNEKWGEGSKKFLRELFESKHGKYNNFYNDILEPLFYEALRIDRSHDDHYYSRFDCKIPFLNGGLFDPIGDYNWVQTDITLPNELFSNNKKTTTGDTGDGILDIFDRYNFTVIEDEPLEKEVAIDPELLGKAYEKFNAIRPDNFDEYLKVLKSGKKGEETKFNKQYGVYYTPREIVHYMCRESLINYLASEFSDKSDAYQKIDIDQLDAFGNTSRKGQLPLEAEYKSVPHIPKSDIETLINYGEMFGENEAVVELKGKETDTYYYKLPESVRKNAFLIDEKLASVLICDPAVGSGAFPVGMMHEIVNTRNLLSIFIKDSARSKYVFKRECIEMALYGVDIDSGAVEIAKLRLWLSLVVDEDDINNIKPLPNLDYKIVCGNSLLGVKKDLLNANFFEQLEKLKPSYFNETRPKDKQFYKYKIDEIILELTSGKRIFDFEVYFSEVFHYNNGFDIIIGNPPYIEFKKFKNKSIYSSYQTAKGKYDIYVLFIELGYKLLKDEGILCFINPTTFMMKDYGRSLRDFIRKYFTLLTIVDFGDFQVFENATNYTGIFLFKKYTIDNYNFHFHKYFGTNRKIKLEEFDQSLNMLSDTKYKSFVNISSQHLSDKSWLFNTIDKVGILSKLDLEKDTELGVITKYVFVGIQSGKDEVFFVNDALIKELKLEMDIIHPILKGKDVNRYATNWSGTYVIYPYNRTTNNVISENEFKGKYPNVYNYLRQQRNKLRGRKYFDESNKLWYELWCERNYKKFKQTKITNCEISPENRFTLDTQGFLGNTKIFNTVLKEDYKENYKFILGLLNSSTLEFFHKNTASPKAGGFYDYKTQFIEKYPIKFTSNQKIKNLIETNVDNILAIKNQNHSSDTKLFEDKINIIVYLLYNLSYDEVKIIDPNIGEIISEEEYEKFDIE